MTVFYLMPVIFVLGILAIAFEDTIKINKAASAIATCIILWLLYLLDAVGLFASHPPEYLYNFMAGFPEFADLSVTQQAYKYLEVSLVQSLGDVSTTLFFVLASMAIIEILDSHGSFSVITRSIKTKSKRKLLWIFSIITFFLSALLGDLATVIVVIAIIRKLVPEKGDRLLYACMTIIAANAGGSWSPIGDVTTLILWTGHNLTAPHQITHVFLPGLVMMLVPLAIVTFMFKKGDLVGEVTTNHASALPSYITPNFQTTLLWIGIASLALVPVLQSVLQLPPFMGVLLGLAILWIITDVKSARSNDPTADSIRVSSLFEKLDISTVLYFLGVLMSVKALNSVGFLRTLSQGLDSVISQPNMTAFLLGICSSFLDNVALVAATMGMYPLADVGAYMTDSSFWTFLAYCSVTGGSILIIGSASGVTVMGIEKIPFSYYLKRFSLLALLGYGAGAGIYLLIS